MTKNDGSIRIRRRERGANGATAVAPAPSGFIEANTINRGGAGKMF